MRQMARAGLLASLLVAVAATSKAAPQIAVPAAPDLDAVEAAVGPPHGGPLADDVLDQRTHQVSVLLRCPVCQGLSVADSPAGMAQNMKQQVRELLAAGYDEEQILSYFEKSYGEFVRLEPPLRGVNWLVWLAPLAGLLVGGAIVVWALRAPRAARAEGVEAPTSSAGAPDDDGSPGPDTLPDDAELAAYVLEVRELAYGWPGGLSPEARDRR